MDVMRSLAMLGVAGAVILTACASDDSGATTGTYTGASGAGSPGATGGTGTTAGGVGTVLPPATVGGTAGGTAGGGLAPGQVTTIKPSACSTQTIDAYGTAPDMLIVLDRSESMNIYGRWAPSQNAVRTITTEFERLLSFGLVMFPGPNAPGADAILNALLGGPVTCSGGERVDVPLKVMNAGPINQTVMGSRTMGLTPTGAALEVALRTLGNRGAVLDNTVKPGYVLLVTDGQPSCDPIAAASGAPDPAQEQAALMAVQALKAASIPTYVIGYQIDPAFQPFMNQMAMAGGTMMYHPAENGDQVVAAFREITKDVVKCSFELSKMPDNPKFVRVTIDGKTVVLDAADGWVLNGKTVTLQGGACATLKDGKGHAVNAQIECNEVVPI